MFRQNENEKIIFKVIFGDLIEKEMEKRIRQSGYFLKIRWTGREGEKEEVKWK